jgi:hypothetical protein
MATYSEKEITPELAAKWLEFNKVNRNVRIKKVREYAEMMTANGWKLNGSGITFDNDGMLVDGQHRLLAVVESGETILSLVTEGVSPGVRPTVDENVKRSFKDDLAMAGIRNSYPNASLMRKIMIWQENGGLARLSTSSTQRPLLAAAWPEHAHDVVESNKEAGRWQGRWPGNTGALAFMVWLLKYEDANNPRMVDRFFQTVIIGSQADEDRVIAVQLRDRLAGTGSYYATRKQVGVPYDVYWMIRGWNAWLTGSHVTKFILPRGGLADPYPKRERAYVVS